MDKEAECKYECRELTIDVCLSMNDEKSCICTRKPYHDGRHAECHAHTDEHCVHVWEQE